MSYIVSAGKGVAYDTKDMRGPHDGKGPALGFGSEGDTTGQPTPGGESGGEYDVRTSKWQGDGQKARHNG